MEYGTKRFKNTFRFRLKEDENGGFYGFVGRSGSDVAEPISNPLFLAHDLIEHNFGPCDWGQAKYEYLASGFSMYNTEHLGSYLPSFGVSRENLLDGFANTVISVIRFCDAHGTRMYQSVPKYRLTGFLHEYKEDFIYLRSQTLKYLEAEFDSDEWQSLTRYDPHTMEEHADFATYWTVQGMRRARKKWNMYGLGQDMLANIYVQVCKGWYKMLRVHDYDPYYRGYKEAEWRKKAFDALQNLAEESWMYKDLYLHVCFDGDNVEMRLVYVDYPYDEYY